MQHGKRGFSLLELLIATALSTITGLALMLLVRDFQIWSVNLELLLERDSSALMAPLMLSRFASPAGNREAARPWSGISFEGDVLEMRSDMDGPESFPDWALEDPFEWVRLRHRDDALQLRSSGSGFQPLFRQVSSFEARLAGSSELVVDLTLSTRRPLFILERPYETEISLRYMIWNRRRTLFEGEKP